MNAIAPIAVVGVNSPAAAAPIRTGLHANLVVSRFAGIDQAQPRQQLRQHGWSLLPVLPRWQSAVIHRFDGDAMTSEAP